VNSPVRGLVCLFRGHAEPGRHSKFYVPATPLKSAPGAIVLKGVSRRCERCGLLYEIVLSLFTTNTSSISTWMLTPFFTAAFAFAGAVFGWIFFLADGSGLRR
jgi:hypothetical protein